MIFRFNIFFFENLKYVDTMLDISIYNIKFYRYLVFSFVIWIDGSGRECLR